MAFLAGPPDRGHGSVLQCKQPPPTLVPPSMTDISYTSLALGLQPAPSLPTHSDTANGKGTATEDLLQVLTVCTASSERHQTLVIGHMKSVEVGSVVSESRLHQAMAVSTAGGDAAAHVFSAANTSPTLLAKPAHAWQLGTAKPSSINTGKSAGQQHLLCGCRQNRIRLLSSFMRRQQPLQLHWECALTCLLPRMMVWALLIWSH